MLSNSRTPITFNFTDPPVNLQVSLVKTLQVQNDGEEHDLPGALEEIQLQANGLDPFVAIDHEKEALYFAFDSNNYDVPVAVKVLTGGQNALTGEKEELSDYTTLRNNNEEGEGQNYLVVPGQDYLDGFVTAEGKVRQFIAVTLGHGNSVEEKLEGTQTGGIQIVAIPATMAVLEIVRERRRLEDLAEREAQRVAAEQRRQLIEEWRLEKITSLSALIEEKQASCTEEEMADLQTLLKKYQEIDLNALNAEYREECEMETYELYSSVVQSADAYSIDEVASVEVTSTDVEMMGLGAGGFINQDIIASEWLPEQFDTSKAQYMKFDIINLQSLNTLKSSAQPPHLLTMQEYEQLGLPWFKVIHNKNTVAPASTSRLVALEQTNSLSALPEEEPDRARLPGVVFNLYGHGLFDHQQPPAGMVTELDGVQQQPRPSSPTPTFSGSE